jgi:hypothetical protein
VGTEKFFVFNEEGTLKRLKGRIVRFLDNEEPDNDDKVAIRSSLSVPASAEGLTPANNLSDVSNAATSRTNLEVNSTAQDAEANGTKLLGPSIYLDGSNFIEVADDPKLSFTDGTDDLPFTVAAWVNMTDASDFRLISKYGSLATNREWGVRTLSDDTFGVFFQSSNSDYHYVSTAAVTGYEGQWVHFAVSYSGSGPSSPNSFANAMDGVSVFINGATVAITPTSAGTYAGLSNTSQPVHIGRQDGTYAKGHIRDVKLFNKALSAAEVKTLCLSGQLPESFAESTGGAWGGLESSDFSSGDDGYATNSGTVTGNTDGVLGVDDTLIHTDPASGTVLAFVHKPLVTVPAGKRVRHKFEYYIPAANTSFTTLSLWLGGSVKITNLTTTGSWATYDGEFVNSTGSDVTLRIYGGTGSSYTGAGESFYLKNIATTQIGSVLDARAEQFDTSTGKLYDLSGNDFVGTQSGGVSLLGREFPVYETGTWTPTITFGGGSTGITYSAQEGTYTRIGDTVHLAGIAHVSGLGSVTGTARVSGLPYTTAAFSPTGSYQTVPVLAFNATGLTSALIGLFEDSQPDMILYQTGSSGGSAASHANFTTSTSIRFSGTYQIQ